MTTPRGHLFIQSWIHLRVILSIFYHIMSEDIMRDWFNALLKSRYMIFCSISPVCYASTNRIRKVDKNDAVATAHVKLSLIVVFLSKCSHMCCLMICLRPFIRINIKPALSFYGRKGQLFPLDLLKDYINAMITSTNSIPQSII